MFDKDLTRHIANLSKINFTDDEIDKITLDMKNIIQIMDKVNDFEANENTIDQNSIKYNELRDDIPESSCKNSDIIKNSKKTRDNSFFVPKMM